MRRGPSHPVAYHVHRSQADLHASRAGRKESSSASTWHSERSAARKRACAKVRRATLEARACRSLGAVSGGEVRARAVLRALKLNPIVNHCEGPGPLEAFHDGASHLGEGSACERRHARRQCHAWTRCPRTTRGCSATRLCQARVHARRQRGSRAVWMRGSGCGHCTYGRCPRGDRSSDCRRSSRSSYCTSSSCTSSGCN